MKQWEKRVIAFQQIYALLFFDGSYEIFIEQLKKSQLDQAIFEIVNYVIKNFTTIKAKIIALLSDNWTWDRVMEIDKAIIFCAVAEFFVWKTEKKIIIDQAIITAKNYSDANSYKFINFILDRILDANFQC